MIDDYYKISINLTLRIIIVLIMYSIFDHKTTYSFGLKSLFLGNKQVLSQYLLEK